MSSAWPRLATVITDRRLRRSTQAPASSPIRRKGTEDATRRRPIWLGLAGSVRTAAHGSATRGTRGPATDTPRPPQSLCDPGGWAARGGSGGRGGGCRWWPWVVPSHTTASAPEQTQLNDAWWCTIDRIVAPTSANRRPISSAHALRPQPRPTYGIFVAITIRNCTLASRGRLAMVSTALATCSRSMRGSGAIEPSACRMPCAIRSVISLAAFPMSICPHAMSYGRPSSDVDLVRPVIACLVAVYGAEYGRGTWAEMEPLLMIRPPRGRWPFITLNASCVQRKAPVRFVSTTALHCSNVRSSNGTDGAPMPALLNRRSSRPNASVVARNRAETEAGSATSRGTASGRAPRAPPAPAL